MIPWRAAASSVQRFARRAAGPRRRKSLRLFTLKQSHAVNVLHDQIIRADIVDLADVGMIQRGDGFGFTLEPLAELRAGT